jgi:hypothetical protein
MHLMTLNSQIRIRIDPNLAQQIGPDQTLSKDGHPSYVDLLQMLSDLSPTTFSATTTIITARFVTIKATIKICHKTCKTFLSPAILADLSICAAI